MTFAGELIRARREAHGLTQAQLAIRAGTTQAAISRLERGEGSPTVARLEHVLAALGEDLEIQAHPRALELDSAHLEATLALSPAERLERAFGWNALAGEIARAGRAART